MCIRAIPFFACAILLATAAIADDEVERPGLVIPDPTAITEEDEKAVRQMLSDYHKVVESGDREKALKFCTYRGKLQESVSKLACEVDFTIEKFRAAVEKKFGKEKWAHVGKMLSEMNPDVLKSLELESSDNPDEIHASWNEKADVGKDRHLPSYITLRKEKTGWKFFFSEDKDELVELRKQFRDEIAELAEITAKVEDGKLKDVDAIKEAINTLIQEMIGEADEEMEEHGDDNHFRDPPMQLIPE
jgi:hypothetical protein